MQPKAKAFRFRAGSARPWLSTRSCLVILAVNWLLQGVRGMDPKELSFRLLLLALLAVTAAAGLRLATPLPPWLALLLGLGLAHTLNFALNGQFWVCLRYCPGYAKPPAALAAQTAALLALLRRRPWLDEAVLIGSAARSLGRPGPRSDIDLRLIFPAGLVGWLRTNLLLLELRCTAALTRLPLDVYAYDHPATLRRFDQSEPMGLVLDRRGRLCRGFANRRLVRLP